MSPAGTVTDPPFTQRCNRWSQSSPGFSGRIGANLAVTSAWTDSTQNAIPCDNQFGALYCFEQ